jgi:hypothetical protein
MITLWNLLQKIAKNEVNGGRIFKIFVAKNILMLKPEIKMIEDNFVLPEKTKEYQGKKRNIYLQYADKDASGSVIFNNDNSFNITNMDDVKTVNELVEKLNKEYANILKEVEEIDKEFKIYTEESQEISLMKITASAIPDSIDINDLTILMELDLIIMGEN